MADPIVKAIRKLGKRVKITNDLLHEIRNELRELNEKKPVKRRKYK